MDKLSNFFLWYIKEFGNFIFDQFTEKQNEGIAVGEVLSNDGNTFQVIPYLIQNSQPKPLDKKAREVFCGDFLKNIPSAVACKFEL